MSNLGFFDYVFVFESASIPEPVSLGLSTLGKVMIMIGDYFINAPYVKSIEADRLGMNVSLFWWLCEKHSKHVVLLKKQYWMNWEILKLLNSVAYSGLIKHGSFWVWNEVLKFPNTPLENPPPWI